MSFNSRHVDMLECDISGKTDRTYLHISWDPINKQYALGLRVFSGRVGSFLRGNYILGLCNNISVVSTPSRSYNSIKQV